jgi:hypothetical protein
MSEKEEDPWILTTGWSDEDKQLFKKILERCWYE